jgi:hypothetical protein
MRTPEEIDKEIQALEEIKPKVRHYSSYGDDYHAAIEAQIDVLKMLKEGMPRVELPLYDDTHIWDAVEEAIAWIDGISEYDTLVEDWKGIFK